MKRLIVTADDLGASVKRNEGILEAHRRGIVTSASLLANGAAFDHAVELARSNPELEVGLHLNLSEGRPLAAGHQTLVDANGEFPGKREARQRARTHRFERLEVECETLAQIQRLLDAGLKVHHLDGHQHIHIFEGVMEPVAHAAAPQGVRFVRCPVDTLVRLEYLNDTRRIEIDDYRRNALLARSTYAKAGLRSTNHFGGVALSGHLTIENLVTTLKSLPDGVTELMVHPGYADAANGFSGPERERELAALTDPRLKLLLQQEGIELTHFGKFP
jgi:predicted glycoside hydrolase/deacetylase ChbG (UPF0249 family)